MGKKVTLKVKAGAAPGFPGFVGWLAETHPKLYSYVQASDPTTVQRFRTRHSAGSLLQGLSGDPVSNDSQTSGFIDTVVKAGAAILPLVQQQKVLNLQLQRAKAGLPPLDVGSYIDPNQGINVGVTPATQKILLWLGGGALGVFLLTRVLGRR